MNLTRQFDMDALEWCDRYLIMCRLFLIYNECCVCLIIWDKPHLKLNKFIIFTIFFIFSVESKQRISLIFILWCWVDFIQIEFSEIWYYTIKFLKQFGFFTLCVGQRPCMTYNCHSTPTPTCQTFMSKIFIFQFFFSILDPRFVPPKFS